MLWHEVLDTKKISFWNGAWLRLSKWDGHGDGWESITQLVMLHCRVQQSMTVVRAVLAWGPMSSTKYPYTVRGCFRFYVHQTYLERTLSIANHEICYETSFQMQCYFKENSFSVNCPLRSWRCLKAPLSSVTSLGISLNISFKQSCTCWSYSGTALPAYSSSITLSYFDLKYLSVLYLTLPWLDAFFSISARIEPRLPALLLKMYRVFAVLWKRCANILYF